MLVLASASPRRKQLLAQAGYSFEVAPSSIPEEQTPGEDPITFAIRMAREKAQAVFTRRYVTDTDLIVLGADTIVVLDNEVLGKPADAADAARMLRLLSGRSHQVVTGVCLVSSADPAPTAAAPTAAPGAASGAASLDPLSYAVVDAAAEVTTVAFLTLSNAEIEAYVATGEPLDKAGAYGIQGYAARWIPRVYGCYFNVVGLPLALVASLIEGAQARALNKDTAPAQAAASTAI